MKSYRINYIDGHDLRYKSFETNAEDESAALDRLQATYPDGDYDHRIVEIIELKEPCASGMRIGEIPAITPLPAAKEQAALESE